MDPMIPVVYQNKYAYPYGPSWHISSKKSNGLTSKSLFLSVMTLLLVYPWPT